MAENEDVPYNVSDFATPDKEKERDPDQPNKGVLIECMKYLNDQIKKHNSLDVIAPEAEATMSSQQQIVAHKEVVVHLRNIKTMLNDKLKELS